MMNIELARANTLLNKAATDTQNNLKVPKVLIGFNLVSRLRVSFNSSATDMILYATRFFRPNSANP